MGKSNINYINNYTPDKLYISDFKEDKGKFISIAFDNYKEIAISERISIRLTYLNEKDDLNGIKITKLNNGSFDSELLLSNFDLVHLEMFLELIKSLKLSELTTSKIALIDGFEINQKSKTALNSVLKSEQGITFLKEFIEEGVLSEKDLVNLKYRKEKLSEFKSMLDNSSSLIEKNWQDFFEDNKWILGYGLDYITTDSLDNKKLEQVVSGFDVNSRGKRVDGLLKTKGIISSLCICEFKTPDTKLMGKEPRPDSWSISSQLSDAIAQIQKTSRKLVENLKSETQMKDSEGYSTNEFLYLNEPKSFIIIGSLTEFFKNEKINQEKYSSFEIFRKNINNPEIITFDELFERAKYIVEHTK